MGVYIKNMIMPKNCFECPFGTDVDIGTGVARGCEFLKDFSPFSNERHNGCPLVSVPEHGRLIDADDIVEKYGEPIMDHTGRTEWTVRIDRIQSAPTIIPADKEE